MAEVEPVFLVVSEDTRGKGDLRLVDNPFYSQREDAVLRVARIEGWERPRVLRLDDMYARVLRAMRELAIKEFNERKNDEEAETKTTTPSDASSR